MDSRNSEYLDEVPSVETPEDVAVLYSWANLHGAKYRDFSASRREYRAQLRHRAAEQVREVELRAQADAEAAATVAEQSAKQAGQIADDRHSRDAQQLQSLRDAEEAAQIALAERVEATRRAEVAAQAEAAARREEREVANAIASARRQAALYAEADSRGRRASTGIAENDDVPGKISDPYTPDVRTSSAVTGSDDSAQPPEPPVELHPNRYRPDRMRPLVAIEKTVRQTESVADQQFEVERVPEATIPPQPPPPPRRPQGYRPDDASGVRQIYRPELDSSAEIKATARERMPAPVRPAARPVPPYATRETTLPRLEGRADEAHSIPEPRVWSPAPTTPPGVAPASRQMLWASSAPLGSQSPRIADAAEPTKRAGHQRADEPVILPERRSETPQGEAAGQLADPTPKRRRQDLAGYRPTDSDRAIAAYRREQSQPIAYANAPVSRPTPEARVVSKEEGSTAKTSRGQEPVGPAWIYAQDSGEMAVPVAPAAPAQESSEAQESVADTLQRSRERVASRWYALKGVFEQAGQERQEAAPVRQKETRTPVLAVFSLAGGVGKTSLVATLGRSLSSLGEKVLLTDTTSHGLLPYYFGASELRQGTVRTFSPPSGSTDAPIYLVNYGVDQDPGDEASQEALVEEIAGSGRGTHRIVLDLTSSTSWVIRRMARLNPTVLVPVAPDMNSVISLQAIEKFFHGVNGGDGTPLKFFYVLNQFDAALPLHLDVREVLRRQLGDRLLPFVIRRAPAVSEALAEGMTIIDYSPEAPVAEDYLNLASWLRAQSAPATAGFRNVRWSER